MMRAFFCLLLTASVLPAQQTAAGLRKGFADPPADFRSMPLWVWNDEMSVPRMQEQLRQYQKQGMGGVFVHPRPGLISEYLNADWFRLWGAAMDEGKRLGIEVNIYDENSYPSGFAGGHVPARAPDTAVQFVEALPGYTGGGGDLLALFAISGSSARRITSVKDLQPGESATGFRLRRASGNPWTAEFPYVDLTNPSTAKEFIATTFEPYKQHFSAEFGKTIRYVFDDEPLLAAGGAYDSARLALPLTWYVLAEFRTRHGYDLTESLPSLFWDTGDFRKVRFDYWQTMHDLWKENYMKPLYEWCDRNGLKFTGHWMEHEWPYPWISPADASLYAFEHLPGIDMLEGTNIRLKGADPHMLFTIKQVASVASQLGRRAFCEAYGVAGWDSTLEHYKRFGDWLMVHGINFMDQHLSFTTVRGARKRDHPQSFSDVSAWWPYYRLHGDHLARWSWLLSNTRPRNRMLLLTPTTSGFLLARRGGATPELASMREDNANLIQALADRQTDFDLGDEYILEWFGKIDGKRLQVGQSTYELVVWPANMINVRSQTVPLLEKYLAAGGEIAALGPPADFVDGRPSKAVKSLAARYAGQWKSVAGAEALAQRLKPRVEFDHALPGGVGMADQYAADGTRLLLFANTGLSAASANVTVEGAGLESWDTVSGAVNPLPAEPADPGRIRFAINLAPAGSAVYRIAATPTPAAKPAELRWQPVNTAAWTVKPDNPNILVLDYCDLKIADSVENDINTWRANWNIWQRHGFERPAWDNAVQFRSRVLDRNHFPPSSGFDATFHFTVDDPAALQGLELAIELPELYKVTLNGTPVSFASAKRWLDPHIAAVPIQAKAGENTVTISAHPFDVRMELENIYLRGNFTVATSAKGFSLKAPKPLTAGSWAAQGYPFYESSVLYQTPVQVPPGAGKLKVELGAWQGSTVEVLLDGKRAAVLGWQPYQAEFDATAGSHTLAVRVVSTPRNLFGPFHNPAKLRMRAWPAAWREFPEHQPPGASYDILDYGLMQPAKASIAMP